MKSVLITLMAFCLSILSAAAQSQQTLLLHYNTGADLLIDLPAGAKISPKDKSSIAIPYGYTLRLPLDKITRQRLVTPQFVADSLAPNALRVTCDPSSITLTNTSPTSYAHIYDSRYRQISLSTPSTPSLSFDPSSHSPGLYWLSTPNTLLGIDTSKSEKK